MIRDANCFDVCPWHQVLMKCCKFWKGHFHNLKFTSCWLCLWCVSSIRNIYSYLCNQLCKAPFKTPFCRCHCKVFPNTTISICEIACNQFQPSNPEGGSTRASLTEGTIMAADTFIYYSTLSHNGRGHPVLKIELWS